MEDLAPSGAPSPHFLKRAAETLVRTQFVIPGRGERKQAASPESITPEKKISHREYGFRTASLTLGIRNDGVGQSTLFENRILQPVQVNAWMPVMARPRISA